MSDLVCELDMPLPGSISVGNGNHLFLRGRCYHREEEIRELFCMIDNSAYKVENHSLATPGALDGTVPLDDRGHVITSTFWTAVPIDTRRDMVHVSLKAGLASGREERVDVGHVALVEKPTPSGASGGTSVAICLVAREPDEELFRRKVASIIAQDHTDWTCIVVDDGSSPNVGSAIAESVHGDARFKVIRNDRPSGTYRALEQALYAVPGHVGFVTLADPDDDWHPSKLSKSLVAFDAKTSLVHHAVAHLGGSPEAIGVDDALLSRAVLGSSVTFQSSQLPSVLPFPPDTGSGDGPSWIVAVGALAGNIRYVPDPLQQLDARSTRILSYRGPNADADGVTWRTVLRALRDPRERIRLIGASREGASIVPVRAAAASLGARTLLLRFGRSGSDDNRTLRRLSRADRSLFALLSIGITGGRRAMWLARSLLLFKALTTFYRRRRKRIVERQSAIVAPQGAPELERRIDRIVRDTTPLNLEVSVDEARRINFITPMIDFRYVYGAYIMVFQVALALSARGHRVRMLVAGEGSNEPFRWDHELRSYPGLETLLDRIEIEQAWDRSRATRVSPKDSFVAITSWTAHIAHHAAKTVGRDRFLYLVMEYDPLVFPVGSDQAVSAAAYDLPHDAIFSTELLRSFFRERGVGVYKEGSEVGDGRSVAIDNPIAPHEIDRDALRTRSTRRLLFYARPEDHAKRNCFELGVLALRELIRRRHADLSDWTFEGIGSLQGFNLPLGNGRSLDVHPRVPLASYLELLEGFDVGLALQATPHCGLVTLDMAASGLIVVTNTFETKSRDDLASISENIVAVPPTVDGIRAGLEQAIDGAGDVDRRLRGVLLSWPRAWDEALPHDLIERIESFRSCAEV